MPLIVPSRDKLTDLKYKIQRLQLLEEQEECQDSLRYFVERAWPHVDPSPFMSNWAIDAVCLPHNAKITTEFGIKTIGEIVDSNWTGNVLSFNHKINKIEWKPIVRHMKSVGRSLLRIKAGGEILLLTGNHPVYVLGKGYIRADKIKVGDVIGKSYKESKTSSSYKLQSLWKTKLCSAISEKRSRFLFNGVLQYIQNSSKQSNLSNLQQTQSLGCERVSCLYGEKSKAWAIAYLRAMWQGGLEIASRISTNAKNAWRILQPEVLWLSYARKKSSSVHQWQQYRIIPTRILDSTAESFETRQSLLFSLWRSVKSYNTSYQSRQKRQRELQFSDLVFTVSSNTTRTHNKRLKSGNGYKVSSEIVKSIERDVWVPDFVYNIEVADNNNYFAENILVHNCDHLEAVMLGCIPNLLINIPPRCAKTTIVSIMFPAWIWLRFSKELLSPLSGPQVKFLCASYSDKLTLLSSTAFRRLVEGEWYQSLNSNLSFMRDQNTKSHMDNSSGGSRQSTSVGGTLLGLGGDILIGDDLNNTESEKLVETGADRMKAVAFWNEFRSTRRNDPRPGYSAVINVQQRTNAGDVSGAWMDSDDDIVQVVIPMRHDPLRHFPTIVLPQYTTDEPWIDPRDPNGEDLMWPERFNEFAVSGLEKALGPYMASGRLQQLPSPKGGGILQRDWWQPWDEIEAAKYNLEWHAGRREFPEMELVVASLDTAYKEKEENDYNSLTIWGIFLDLNRNRRAMLMFAWMKRLPLNGKVVSAYPHELPIDFERRKKENWGLVDWIADGCKRYKVKRLLIEDKSRGHDVANEIRRLYTRDNWGVQLLNPVGDKVSRAHGIVPLFTDDAIYAPYNAAQGSFIKWAEQVIDQCAKFPKDTHDDHVDSATQFLNWARENSLLERADEVSAAIEEAATFKHKQDTVADMYGV